MAGRDSTPDIWAGADKNVTRRVTSPPTGWYPGDRWSQEVWLVAVRRQRNCTLPDKISRVVNQSSREVEAVTYSTIYSRSLGHFRHWWETVGSVPARTHYNHYTLHHPTPSTQSYSNTHQSLQPQPQSLLTDPAQPGQVRGQAGTSPLPPPGSALCTALQASQAQHFNGLCINITY